MPGVFIILLMLLLGNGLSSAINGIIPGSDIGMVLLFLALLSKIIKPEMIRKPAGYLINHMSLFFDGLFCSGNAFFGPASGLGYVLPQQGFDDQR